MDLIILLVLIAFGFFFFKRFSNFVYFIVIVDIFLRVVTYIANNIGVPELSNFIYTYFPASIPSIIGKYTNGVATNVLMWVYVFIVIIFETYVIRTFLKKR